MVRREIREAVVLAAGNGLRMASPEDLPKPLTPVAGMTLLERSLAALPSSIQTAHVVIGYRGGQIRSAFGDQCRGRILNWITNPSFALPNGVSLFCAEGKVDSPFLLVMCDHLFAPGLLDRFCDQGCPPDGGLLAVDRKIDQVFDLPDAMKLELREDAICSIGKQLDHYDAIDTGAFLFSGAVFEAFLQSRAEHDLSLAGAVRILARKGRMRVWDIGLERWADIDTPGALADAERLLKMGYLWNGDVACEQCFDVTPRTA
jgi:1L-myo-inositol 1-phosphate cytidylyltransferase